MRTARLTLLAALLTVSCFLGLTRGLWTPDEPREAGISREMAERPGVIPTLNRTPFIEKPPLYYWLTALSFRLAGGPGAAAARSVSGLASLFTLAAVFLWISRAKDTRTAAIACVYLGTFAAFVTSAHWVRIDAVLMLFVTIALGAAWERLGRGGGAGSLALFYAGLVLALWTKGLIGPVLVGAGLAAYAALGKSLAVLRPVRPVLSAAVLVAAVAALAAAIAGTGGYEALRTWFYVNHVERFVHPVTTGHKESLFYYAWTLPAAIAPWVVPLAALFHVKGPLWRRDRGDAALLRFALAFTVGPLLVLSLASSKRQVYLLPLLPPLALLMAASTLDRIERENGGAWARAGDWLQATILGALALAPAVAEIAIARRATVTSAVLLVLGLAAAGRLAGSLVTRELGRAFWAGAACIGVGFLGVVLLATPRVDAVKDFEPFIRTIDAALPAGEPVPAIGADETLLGIVPFFTGRRVVPLDAGAVPDTAFVLVQSSGDDRDPAVLETAYDRVASREFGPRRRMTLWRRRS